MRRYLASRTRPRGGGGARGFPGVAHTLESPSILPAGPRPTSVALLSLCPGPRKGRDFRLIVEGPPSGQVRPGESLLFLD